jgi:transcriptional antiterminator RfaH
MAFWAVVRAAPNRERLACESVVQAGFEIFVPRIRVRVGSQWRTTPLFGSYFFARIIDRWRVIERSPGVLSTIKFGTSPARCPDEEIARLIERSDRDGIIRLPPRPLSPPRRTFSRGAMVAIADGPFAGFSGLYAGQTVHDREIILLDILGASRPVEVSAGLLAPH